MRQLLSDLFLKLGAKLSPVSVAVICPHCQTLEIQRIVRDASQHAAQQGYDAGKKAGFHEGLNFKMRPVRLVRIEADEQ